MNKKVVELLESLLAKANRGEIVGIAVATTVSDLSTGSCFVLGDSSLAELIGTVAMLKHRLLNEGSERELD